MNNKNIVTNESFEELFQVTTMEKLYPGSPEGNMFVLVSSIRTGNRDQIHCSKIEGTEHKCIARHRPGSGGFQIIQRRNGRRQD